MKNEIKRISKNTKREGVLFMKVDIPDQHEELMRLEFFSNLDVDSWLVINIRERFWKYF